MRGDMARSNRLPGTRWGRFELERLLGKGAMGSVYQARDPDLGREVALKFLDGAMGPERAERFRREGEATAALDHPNVIKVHSWGTEEGVPYLVYELIPEARTLRDVLPALPCRERVALLRDAARGLGHAHARGVVHRDVKPDNVLVDPQGQVKVGDFGLAAAGGWERLTRSGALVGTPLYMAPELLRGDREGVAPTADVYAVGVMLFEALTGRLPFGDAQGLQVLAYAANNRAAPSARSIDPTVPPELEAICGRALEREASRRYPHADALADDLEAWLGGRAPTVPVPAGPGRGVAVGLGLSLLLALGAVLAVRLLGRERAPEQAARPAPTPPPPASPAPTREAPPQPGTPAWERAGREAWSRATAGSDPRVRLAAAKRFLAEFPGHPAGVAARELVEELRYGARLFRMRHPEGRQHTVGAVWEGELLGLSQSSLARWSLRDGSLLGTRAVGELAATDPNPFPRPARGGGGLALGQPGGGWWVWFDPRRVAHEGSERLEEVALSPDGALLACAERGRPGQLRLLGRRGEEVAVLTAPEPWLVVDGLTFAPDGKLAASFGGDRDPITGSDYPTSRLQIWEAGSWEPLATRTLGNRVRCLVFTPDGKTLLLGTTSGQILLHDTRAWEEQELLSAPASAPLGQRASMPGSLRGMALDPDGVVLYALSKGEVAVENVLGIWSLPERRLLRPIVQLDLPQSQYLDLTPDGAYLVLGGVSPWLEVWATERAAPPP